MSIFTTISGDLETSMNSLEKLLNENDSQLVLDTIRKFKEHKTLEEQSIKSFQENLN